LRAATARCSRLMDWAKSPWKSSECAAIALINE
jgi:hypothetical protein